MERQIAGPRHEAEDTQEVSECEKFERVHIEQVTKHGRYGAGTFTGTSKKAIVRRAVGTPCNFGGGEVEVWIEDHTWATWVCPSCGFQNGFEVEPPEPNDEYEPDRWFD